jgi:hypothetical protein
MTPQEELTTYALLTGSVNDAVFSTPIRKPVTLSIVGVGAPPVAVDPASLWARAIDEQYVVVADALAIPLDSASSSTPPPQHVSSSFPLRLRFSADGYVAQEITVNVAAGSQIPITPAAVALNPIAVALRGRVMLKGTPPTPLAGASVAISATVPAGPLPAPVTADANGFYVFSSLPLVQSLSLSATSGAHTGSQTITIDYSSPVNAANFLLT